MIDIDHFKKFNDSYGHPAGDVVLKQVARHIANAVRLSDIVCRYGGEEMLVVMPDGVELPSVTVSIGVAIYPDRALGRGELVSCADQALYRAKKSGRDRVVWRRRSSAWLRRARLVFRLPPIPGRSARAALVGPRRPQ